jgi:hypothetical protein
MDTQFLLYQPSIATVGAVVVVVVSSHARQLKDGWAKDLRVMEMEAIDTGDRLDNATFVAIIRL